MKLEDLKLPFEEKEIEFRIGRCGKNANGIWTTCLAYIDARAIQERLDKVCGPENWQVKYETLISDKISPGIMCSIGILVGDKWVWKQDGADQTDTEAFKGGLSSAFKRAGSAWGMGRYLYDLTEGFAKIVEKGFKDARYGKTKEGESFYWIPPSLPTWALPTQSKSDEGIPTVLQKKDAKELKQMVSDLQKQQALKNELKNSIGPSNIGHIHKWELSKFNSNQEYCFGCKGTRDTK